jgi:hypothetical protein
LWAAASAVLVAAPFVVFGVINPALRRDLAWGLQCLGWTVAVFTLLAFGLIQSRALGRAREAGFTGREVLAILFRQPPWWTGPWPRALRWSGDVWARLPPMVKVMRCLTLVPLLVLAVGVPLSLALGRPSAPAGWGTSVVFTVIAFLVTTLLAVVGVYALPRGQSALCALPTMDVERWRDPLISRHLRKVEDGAPAAAPTTPGQQAEALARLAGEITGPARAVAEQAAAAGRRLASALAGLDRQAAELARLADEEELRRLDERLAALGAAAPGEAAETVELRQLLTRQRDLVRPMEDRLHVDKAARERLRALLSRLHGEMALLQLALQEGGGSWREAEARLEGLCHEAAALAPETAGADIAATRTR